MTTQPSPSPAETKPKIVAAIPCFNEERFIGSMVAKTRKYVDQVIVVDDGSSDDSAEIAEATGAILHRHHRNRGYGAAIISCLEQGKLLSADVLVIVDGDGQHDPKDIPRLIKPIVEGQADVVVGSRFIGRNNRAPLYRRIGQRVLTIATNLASGNEVTDSQSGCRAYSSRALQTLHLTERGMSISSEIQFAIEDSHLRLVEVPINVSYDEGAKRSPISHGLAVLARVMVLFSLRYPLWLFGVPGLVLLAGGLVLGIHSLDVYDDTRELPLGSTMLTIFLCLAGILGVFAALMLQAMKELIRRKEGHQK